MQEQRCLTKVLIHGAMARGHRVGDVAKMCRCVAVWLGFFIVWTAASAAAQVTPQNIAAANKGFAWSQGRTASWHYAQHQKLSAEVAALKPQRPGVVDAYLVVIGLDSDGVFGREAAEAARVLARRYDAAGRTILLSAGRGAANDTIPTGSPDHLAIALGAVAARMNLAEDALILYTTSHGAPQVGLTYQEGDAGYGMIAPARLASMLHDVGIERRLVMISACFSGEFVAPLASPDTAIVTAADNDRTSFGCAPGNDWTFFGDALINIAFRKPQGLQTAISEAFSLISDWEFTRGLSPSQPRSFIGEGAKTWLGQLEKRMPAAASAKVGRPAIAESGQTPPQH
jgi:hypothetical protein